MAEVVSSIFMNLIATVFYLLSLADILLPGFNRLFNVFYLIYLADILDSCP